MEDPGKELLYTGGCHCGEVRFEVSAPAVLQVIKCNCSICRMKQNYHFIVPNNKFKLTKGEDRLRTYTFNTHKAKHTFCKICGVQSFYTPRSNPDGKGVMPHCLDQTVKIEYEEFDGMNWERSMQKSPNIKSRSENI